MATIIHAKDLRSGHTILYKNNIYLVLENSFNKTAMREGIVKCKIKNLRNSSITIEVLTGERLEQATVMRQKCTYSYSEGQNYIFMDNETFDQYELPVDKIDWEKNFLVEGQEVLIIKYENEILGINLPDLISIQIRDAEDAVKGNTVQSAQKKAILETGYTVNVPQFINSGERILISTVDGTYSGRSKND
ncbi:MAG: elongation factor P [Mycoplasmoidaceae bacterium]